MVGNHKNGSDTESDGESNPRDTNNNSENVKKKLEKELLEVKKTSPFYVDSGIPEDEVKNYMIIFEEDITNKDKSKQKTKLVKIGDYTFQILYGKFITAYEHLDLLFKVKRLISLTDFQ